MSARIEQLEANVQKLATTQSNHLGHAMAQVEASAGPSTVTIVVAAAAVLAVGAWAFGLFDSAPKAAPYMGQVEAMPQRSSGASLGDALDFVGKAARAVKSVKGLF
jgi:hypothetical protein